MAWHLPPDRASRRFGRAGRTASSAVALTLAASTVVVIACAPRAPDPTPRGEGRPLVAPAAAAVVRPPPARPVSVSTALDRELRTAAEAGLAEGRAEPALPVADTLEMRSTAYCLKGRTRTGVRTRDGIAAGDPEVLPLGSVVRLSHPDGEPIGLFVIMDTGGAVRGNKIDIYMDDCAAARRWGTRPVVAEVLDMGRA